MSYIKAETILPANIIEIIQLYVDGANIYIPRKQENKQRWGTKTTYQQDLHMRNQSIYQSYQSGMRTCDLANQYYLSEKSIQRIIRDFKKK